MYILPSDLLHVVESWTVDCGGQEKTMAVAEDATLGRLRGDMARP